MTSKEFIANARDGGYHLKADATLLEILLDPLAWQSVGKVYKLYSWKSSMRRMMNCIINGQTVEQFLETI